LRHGRGDLLRAVYEGTAFGIRQILELFADASGPPARVVAVGGGASSELWLQIVGDVAGVSQEVPAQTIGACYGDCLLAAIGVGLVPDRTDWSQPGVTIEPRPEHRELYDSLYALYTRLYTETADIVHHLAKHDSGGTR
jgi:xylulokinase